MNQQFTNHLGGESSLYLQQHAHNPVDWYPWSDEAWTRARKENKLVLISIGYSSCHWCHVMEHETFTDTEAARIMNEHFICIKVDREERPDIDQIYMTAVQLMTGSGGWPLNCFALPDGRPIYGGTYFPKHNWMQVLTQLDSFYKSDPAKAAEYANELTKGIQNSEIVTTETTGNLSAEILPHAIAAWKNTLDNVEGGTARAPKFPMPGNYLFLLRYAVTQNDKTLLDHVKLTLNKMAFGGIYDHLAGGFARYSTDTLWKVPHFEKMLYDNAQLSALYSNAYKVTKDPLYRKIAVETIDFLEREMSDGKGGYYSAIDADSEGEEGKYYVWTKEELQKIQLPESGKADPYSILNDYYNVNDHGYWEKNHYIFLRKKSSREIAEKHGITDTELESFITKSNTILYNEREKRIRPALDKKIITSWNALQITQLCYAFQAFGDERFRKMAIDCAEGIMNHAVRNGMLLHVRGQKNNNGFLEDYSFTITSFILLYQITLDEKWLLQAKKFADLAIEHFYDENDGFFYFSPVENLLIARKKEISDNVIPASNSEMANALYILGDYFEDEKYTAKAVRMANSIEENILRYPSSHSNWMNLYMNLLMPFLEIAVTGENAMDITNKFSKEYLPNAIIAGTIHENSSLPLLKNRYQNGKTFIYICRNKTCNLPTENYAEALMLLKSQQVTQ